VIGPWFWRPTVEPNLAQTKMARQRGSAWVSSPRPDAKRPPGRRGTPLMDRRRLTRPPGRSVASRARLAGRPCGQSPPILPRRCGSKFRRRGGTSCVRGGLPRPLARAARLPREHGDLRLGLPVAAIAGRMPRLGTSAPELHLLRARPGRARPGPANRGLSAGRRIALDTERAPAGVTSVAHTTAFSVSLSLLTITGASSSRVICASRRVGRHA